MRILLIATNRHKRLNSRMNAQPLPIGLAYIAGHLDPTRHPMKMLDLMFSEDDYLDEVEQTVHGFEPDLLGISIRNLSNHSYLDPQWQLPITKAVVARLRATTEAPIVCGGPAFSILPKECFAYVEPDLGLAGDAGETFAELVSRLEREDPSYIDLPGLVYRQGDSILANRTGSSPQFRRPPRLEGLDMAKYNQAGFGIGVLTKLGGFYYPTAHASMQVEDGAWRVIRPIAEVVQEVKDLEERFGLRKIFFIDNCFNIPLAHAKALCQALIKADLPVHWNTVLGPAGCDAELIQLMKQAGCALVLMAGTGGESQKGIALDESLQSLRQTCLLCEAGGLHYTISQTFGEPGETRETVEQKLTFVRSLQPAMANIRIGVSILPGTAVATRALDEGLIHDEAALIRPTFYLAPEVREWMVEYLTAEAAHNPRWNLM
jgi:radical SAM superfamily enzyme YgiQ (UPF0313 family)